MSKNIIFVTGYFGAPIREVAEKTAEREGCALLSLDEEIEKADGRSILRICMLMGEHEYRNKEYEILAGLPEEDLVVYCGDGVLNDEMSRDIILKHRLESLQVPHFSLQLPAQLYLPVISQKPFYLT